MQKPYQNKQKMYFSIQYQFSIRFTSVLAAEGIETLRKQMKIMTDTARRARVRPENLKIISKKNVCTKRGETDAHFAKLGPWNGISFRRASS